MSVTKLKPWVAIALVAVVGFIAYCYMKKKAKDKADPAANAEPKATEPATETEAKQLRATPFRAIKLP